MSERKNRGFISESDLEKEVFRTIEDPEMDDFVKTVLEAMDDEKNDQGGGADEPSDSAGDPTPDTGDGTDDSPEPQPEDDASSGNDSEPTKAGDSDNQPPDEDSPSGDSDGGKEEDGPDIHYISLEDMMKQTETTVTITKESSEPTPVFGSSDTKPHDKYRITIKNGNGSVNFIYWAPEKDTGIPPKKEEVLKSIAKDCADYGNSMTLDEFRSKFGYDDVDVEIAQKSYDGFRKFIDDLQKMFPDDYWEFVSLASEDGEKKTVSESADDDERQWEEYSTQAVENYRDLYKKDHGKDPTAEEENAFYDGLSYCAFGDLNHEARSWSSTKIKKEEDPELPF